MVMDSLVTCYTAQMRICTNPDTVVTVRWYPAPRGAKIFPGSHRFGSSIWETDDREYPQPGLGEVDLERESARSDVFTNARGQTPGSPLNWFLNGVPASAIAAAPPAFRSDCVGAIMPYINDGGAIGGGELVQSVTDGGALAGGEGLPLEYDGGAIAGGEYLPFALLRCVSTLTAEGHIDRNAEALLASIATLTADSAVEHTGSALLVSEASVTVADGYVEVRASATLSCLATLTASGVVVHAGDVFLSQIQTISASGFVSPSVFGDALIESEWNIIASGFVSPSVFGDALLEMEHTLTADGTVIPAPPLVEGSAALHQVHSLTATGTVVPATITFVGCTGVAQRQYVHLSNNTGCSAMAGRTVAIDWDAGHSWFDGTDSSGSPTIHCRMTAGMLGGVNLDVGCTSLTGFPASGTKTCSPFVGTFTLISSSGCCSGTFSAIVNGTP